MRKKLFLILLAVCVVCTGAFIACEEDLPESSTSASDSSSFIEDTGSVELDVKSLTLREYESRLLSATKIDIDDDVELVWSSSDTTVATVVDGKVSALKAGSAVIKVEAGEYYDECQLTVLPTEVVPTAVIEGESEVNISLNDEFRFTAKAYWESEDFSETAVFAWSVEDEDVLEIKSQNGGEVNVYAKAIGTTVINLIATVRGKTALATVSVNVKPVYLSFATDEEFVLDENGFNVKLYTANLGNESLKTSAKPSLSATFRGQPVDVTMTWRVEQNAEKPVIERAEDGTITAKSAGTAKVIGTTTYAGAQSEVVFFVTVVKPESVIDGVKKVELNRATDVTLEVGANANATVTLGETTLENTFTADENGVLTLAKELFADMVKGTDADVAVETESVIYKLKVNVVDFALGTKEEFMAWYGNYAAHVNDYIVLTADIDFGGDKINQNIVGYWWKKDYVDPDHGNDNVYFKGTFDGQNHVLSNFNAHCAVFAGIGKGAVVKNVSMVDYTVTQYGLVACAIKGGTLENCYFQGKLTGDDHNAAVINTINPGTLKNVVVVAYGYNGAAKPSVAGEIWGSKLNGVYVFDNATNGSITNKGDISDLDAHVYKNVFESDVTALPESFDASVWTVYNGAIMPNVVKAYCETLKQGITFEINDASVKFNGESELGAKINGVAADDVVYTFEGMTEDQYTFVNGILTVTAIELAGKDITVNARSIANGVIIVEAQKTFRVGKEPLVKNLDEEFVAKNRVQDITVTLGEGETFVALYVNSEKKDAGFTVNNGVLTLSHAFLSELAAGTYNITIETETATKSVEYKFAVSLVDFAIDTKEEFMAWYGNYVDHVNDYIVLTADIDFGGDRINQNIVGYWWKGGYVDPDHGNDNIYFKGTFDGQNHVLSNFVANCAVFAGIGKGAVVKNVSMVDYTVTQYGLIACTIKGGTLENCYFQGKLTGDAHSAAAFDSIDTGSTLKNVVLVAYSYNGTAKPSVAGVIYSSKINGVYVFDSATNGTVANSGDLANLDAHVYKNVLESDVTALPEGFDASVWSVYNGVIMPIVVKAYCETLEQGMTFEINDVSVKFNGESELGAKINGAAADTVFYTFEGMTEGQYTFVNGILTVTATELAGKEIIVKACAIANGVIIVETQKTFKVGKEPSVKNLEDEFVAKNRVQDITVTLGEGETFVALYVNSEKKDTDFTVENGVLTISHALFSEFAAGTCNITIEAETASKSIEYKLTVSLVDFAIGTKEEFMAWYANYADHVSDYIVLTADIDFGGDRINQNIVGYWWKQDYADPDFGGQNVYFRGTFDGHNHVLSNFAAYCAVFAGIGKGGVVKNVSMINYTVDAYGLIGCGLREGRVENSYFQGVITGAGEAAGQSHNAAAFDSINPGTLKDVVVVAYGYNGDAKPSVAGQIWGTHTTTSVTGVYVFDSGTNGKISNNDYGSLAIDAHVYKSVTEAAITALPENFDATVWTIDPVYGLTTKAAAAKFESLPKFITASNRIFMQGEATYMSAAHADMKTETETLNGLALYSRAYNNVGNGMLWRGLSGYSQYNFAVKADVNQSLSSGGIPLTANVWNYIIVKKVEGVFKVYISTDMLFGYKEVAIGAYIGYLNATADVLIFSNATTFNAYFTDIYFMP